MTSARPYPIWLPLWLAALAIAAGPLCDRGLADERPARPNFVIINIDDLGYADIGPFGGRHPTPNLDRMAKEGRRLTSHYAAPVCSPSRASLLTGCYPKRVLPIPHVLFPDSAVGLHPDEVTVAEVLRGQGYATACIGKWHLGDQPEFLPTRQGFDYYFGLPYSNDMGPAEDGSKSNFGQPLPRPRNNQLPQRQEDGVRGLAQPPLPLLENETVIERVRGPEQTQLTRQYTERAVQFIREHRDEPFFLYLPHTAVHFPLYPHEDFRGRSQNGLFGDWVMEVDWSVGQVLDTLRELKLAEKTLVIFTSDNGGAIRHGSSNEPLRGGKGDTFEGGIRVPTIAWWPGVVPAGTSAHEITSTMDVLPTLAYLAGGSLPQDRRIDGVNVWPVIAGTADKEPPRTEFYYFRGLDLRAVRSGPWKLDLRSGELYHLENDLGEKTNVAAQHPDVVQRLKELAAKMEADLGTTGIGPGCRPLGRVENPLPLISNDGTIRPGFEGKKP
jgi:arylsulfatase A